MKKILPYFPFCSVRATAIRTHKWIKPLMVKTVLKQCVIARKRLETNTTCFQLFQMANLYMHRQTSFRQECLFTLGTPKTVVN
jgi:hypothetical protein